MTYVRGRRRVFVSPAAFLGLVLLTGCGGGDATSPDPDPLLDALEAHYTFSGDVRDGSGNGHHGTLLGGATVTGGALVTGSNDVDALELPSALMDGMGDFSIAGWVKINTFHVFPGNWISCATAADDNNLGIWYDQNNDHWSIDILGDRLSFADNTAMEDQQFHHVVVTRSGTVATLYVDGAFVGTVTVLASPIGVDPGGFIIGQDQDSVGGGFTTENSLAGEVDELRVYSRAVTATEVAAMHALGR